MNNNVKAIVFEQPNVIDIKEFKLGPCANDDIIVRTLFTMVSSGTELRVLSGKAESNTQFPLIPGYSVIGEVIHVGEHANGYKVGDLVSGRNPCKPIPGINSMWGGQAGMHIYPTTGDERPALLPADCNPLNYVIAETAAISLRGVNAANPQQGETAVVLGQGIIGAFSGVFLNERGCRVIVADLDDSRLERARRWGAAAVVKIAGENDAAAINVLVNEGADIVVESSGGSRGVLLAHQLIRKTPNNFNAGNNAWPRLVMQATYTEPVSIAPFKFFTGKGVTIITPSDRGLEERQKVIEAIRRKAINPGDFIQNVVSYENAPSAYAALRDDKSRNFSLVFDWTKA